MHCTNSQEDHDTLTAIDGKLASLILRIDDHEKRVRMVERVMFIGIGVAAIVKLIVN